MAPGSIRALLTRLPAKANAATFTDVHRWAVTASVGSDCSTCVACSRAVDRLVGATERSLQRLRWLERWAGRAAEVGDVLAERQEAPTPSPTQGFVDGWASSAKATSEGRRPVPASSDRIGRGTA